MTLPDGGLPFALPVPDPAGCAPFWASPDATTSSLQITAVAAESAYRVAEHDPAVAGHPWLARATAYCLAAVRGLGPQPQALELAFAVRFLDSASATHPGPLSCSISSGSTSRPTGWCTSPAARRTSTCARSTSHRDRGARRVACSPPRWSSRSWLGSPAQQQPDGGWAVDFDSYSPAAALEWRGHRTVEALGVLRDNGVL